MTSLKGEGLKKQSSVMGRHIIQLRLLCPIELFICGQLLCHP